MFCLPLEKTKKFIESLKKGEIDPGKLAELSSAERRAFLGKIVGEADAQQVNALFESKLLLKNQQKGMIDWAEKVSGIKAETKKGIVEKINRLDKVLSAEEEVAFLEDLASKRFGVELGFEDAQKLVEMARDVEAKKALIPDDAPLRSKERLDYGLADYLLKDYVAELKIRDTRTLPTQIKDLIMNPGKTFIKLAGITKSFVASLDNSFFGRQGIKVLFTNPDIWGKSFLKSWTDIGKALKGVDPVAPIKADIYSRPNALNGAYTKSELAIGIRGEEAYPSSLPSRIPYLGRLFKASESAYNGAALRMRADLFDRFVSKAERHGVDITNPDELKGLGKLTNSMTGRGNIGKLEVVGDQVNAVSFSIKFLKSNLDTLTAHQLDTSLTKFARQEAALNTLKIVGATAGVLYTANLLWPGSVNFDPTSSDFGKIKIGNTRFDVSGGMSSIVVLSARLASKIDDTFKGKKPKFGDPTGMDILYNFAENKTSPMFRTGIDILKGYDYNYEPLTPEGVASNLVTPLSVDNFIERQNTPNAANQLLTTILDGLGISSTTYQKK